MDVRIDEARGDEGALQVDDLRRLAAARADRIGTDRGDAVALDADCVAEARRTRASPDTAIDIGRVEHVVALGKGGKIWRASIREKVCQYGEIQVGAVNLKKT